ncbi:FtsW/RodA/SpoVE family cell cycle protein [Scatolibacter rhodanostii]|uniref:FtsW/RodA/SpoVE family cell cycle protein n=1 Tax=Scatolibacter rhodanostii TaxID=2014781 RepID=UPI000C08337A|nr:FtsW/RodA/SpoVE family cell cycle protein [Scatolibacter rhodanostii]
MKTKKIGSTIFSYIRRSDILLWINILVISVYSLALLKSVSRSPYASTDYTRTQFLAIILGLIGAVIISLIDYENLANLWAVISIFSFAIMLYTILFGISVEGSNGVNARAWIQIAGRSFQPSELVKVLFIITFAKHLDALKKKGMINEPIQVILLFAHAAVPMLLCVVQGDAGAGVVFFFIFLTMSFSAGIQLRYFVILFALFVVSIPILWNFVMDDYQKMRFDALNNLDDPEIQNNIGYQQYHGRTSIASGGFSGFGLNQGKRVAANSVIYQESDFILSVVGEELGFIGIMSVFFLLLFLMFKTLRTASQARDELGRYMCFGFFGMIAIQTIINVGMVLALLPVMGVTLPFFSSGGSSAMCLYFGFGLVENVYMRRGENDGSRLVRKQPLRYPISR